MLPPHALYIQRQIKRRNDSDRWTKAISSLCIQVLTPQRTVVEGWGILDRDDSALIYNNDGTWTQRTQLTIAKRSPDSPAEWKALVKEFKAIATRIVLPNSTIEILLPEELIAEESQEAPPVDENLSVLVKSPQEIEIPQVLISGTDDEIEEHPAIQGIYGRGAHIRMLFDSVSTALDTRFTVVNHVLLEGDPAGAKSQIGKALKNVVGPGGFHEFNACSLTKAGLLRLFFETYRDRTQEHWANVPPFWIFEEFDKISKEVAEILLRLLDDAREVRRTFNRGDDFVRANLLCVAVINDRKRFESLAGGALEGRFKRKIFVPLPDRELIRRILYREVERMDGDEAWVEPCLQLMDITSSRDTREIIGWLAGRERLLTGQYQEDLLATRRSPIPISRYAHQIDDE